MDVWAADTRVPADVLARINGVLSTEEQARAARHALPDRFTATRAGLRRILSAYLQCEPAAVQIRSTSNGKPELQDESRGIRFSLSHSGDLVVFAVMLHDAIGVDVELIKPDRPVEVIARRHFADSEQQALFQVAPGSERALAFYHYWTGKEAFFKATGAGLRFPLSQVVVSIPPEGAGRASVMANGGTAGPVWPLEHAVPAARYLCAVCTPRIPVAIRYRAFSIY